MPFCRPISEQLEAPLVVIGVGSSLAVVGTVPVVITLSLGINTSATIIGVGFIGFGFLIILPGICWCLVSHLSYSYRFWRHPATTRTCADLEEALVLSDMTGSGVYGGTESGRLLNSKKSKQEQLQPNESCAPQEIENDSVQ